MMNLKGASLAAASATTDSLVIFCHGYGSNGEDLIGLGQQWQKLLPTTAFLSPNAPMPCAGAPQGYQWFPIGGLAEGGKPSSDSLLPAVQKASNALEAFIKEHLNSYHLTPSKVALVGFSQGTMMSLYVGHTMQPSLAAVVGYSGALPHGEQFSQHKKAAPPVLLVHGSEDPMIPAPSTFQAAQTIGAAGGFVQWHISPGLGHSIDMAGLELGGKFLFDSFYGEA